MKKEIIDMMRVSLNDTKFCKSDFEYDLKALNNYDGPFFWMVRQNGTSLQRIGASEMLKWKENQGIRFQLFRNPNYAITEMQYWNEPDAKYFYYDGLSLTHIEKDNIAEIWSALFSSFFQNMVEEFRDEYDIRDKALEITYASEDTEKKVNEALKFAESLKDESLKNCLENLSRHWRSSDNHVIQIYNDFDPNSFGWSEVVNGKCIMNGGLIYHGYKENNHWQIHT